MRGGNYFLLGVFLAILAAGVLAGVAATFPPVRDRAADALIWWNDTSAPAVFIESPAGPVSGTIRLTARVEDRGPTEIVGVTLDGRSLGPAASIEIDTRSIADGPHEITVIAEDRSRRRNRGSGRAVFASDNTPPVIAIRVVPETIAQGRTLYVEVATDGPTGRATATIDGRFGDLYPDAGRAWLVWGIPPAAAPGPITVTVAAADEAGNVARATRAVTVTEYPFPVERIDAPETVAAAITNEAVNAEGAAFEALTSGYRPEKLWSGPFLEPVDAPISSEFGTRRQYNVAPPGPNHGGTDYAAWLGTPVVADAAGIVVLAERQTVRGRVVAIDHGLGVYTAFLHLDSIAVEPGRRVEKGDLIGTVGTTGLSTGPHLHWETRIRGVPVDPREWIRRTIPPGQRLDTAG